MRAKAIVTAADEMPAEERPAFIERTCSGDAALRAEVAWQQQALDADPGPVTPFFRHGRDQVPDRSGNRTAASSASEYRIVRRLGQGGMGVVYLAERCAGDTVQPVALKLLNAADEPDEGLLRRFAGERRILAGLNHPNIARLLDAGHMADGQPFLAMEYVEGERIDHWCAARQPSLERRIALFLKVCAAVRHAHSRLVIHRDIKPANILVDAEGEPKLLDFGIARLLDDAAALRTDTGARALTLAYASPEQIRNEPLGTASDVWQLGAVLYELVSGVRPFRQSDSPLLLSQAIVTGEVPPPSRQRGAGAEHRGGQGGVRIPADIDAIVLKALRVAPSERYAGVAELADDLGRFLDSRPVMARRGQRWYRLRRLAWRYRGALAAGLAIAALLTGFIVDREAQLRRTEIERDKAQALVEFTRELFENADPTRTRGRRITVAEALEQGAQRLGERADLDPEVRAAMLLSIGRGYNALDMGDRAIAVLRLADVLQAQAGRDPLMQGQILAALGRAHSLVLDIPPSIAAGRRAIALLEQAPGDHGDAILRVRINVLFGHLNALDRPLAEVTRELEAIVAELEARDAPDRELHVQALAALAMARASAGEDAIAIAIAGEALVIAIDLYARNDPALAYYRFVAALVKMRTEPAQAIAEYRQQIAEYEDLAGVPTPGLGSMLVFFGWALAHAGQHADAAAALERAEAITREFSETMPDFHLRTLTGLARQYVELDRVPEAAALLRPQVERLQGRADEGHAWAINNQLEAWDILALAEQRDGRHEAALDLYRKALAVADGHFETASPRLRAASLAGLGRSQLSLGQVDEAAAVLNRLEVFAGVETAARAPTVAFETGLLRARWQLASGQAQDAQRTVADLLETAPGQPHTCGRLARELAALVREADVPTSVRGCA